MWPDFSLSVQVERDIRDAIAASGRKAANTPRSALHMLSWFRIILDEAHLIKVGAAASCLWSAPIPVTHSHTHSFSLALSLSLSLPAACLFHIHNLLCLCLSVCLSVSPLTRSATHSLVD